MVNSVLGVLLKMLAKPMKNPMVFMIIIPFLNGYFIGNILNIFRQTQVVFPEKKPWKKQKEFESPRNDEGMMKDVMEKCAGKILWKTWLDSLQVVCSLMLDAIWCLLEIFFCIAELCGYAGYAGYAQCRERRCCGKPFCSHQPSSLRFRSVMQL